MSTMDMAAEERLDAMLASGKISPDEYDRLRGAMRRDPRTRPPEPRRKLAKSQADRQVFGVCAGLAKCFGVDPWIVRLLFVLGYFYTSGAFFLVYVILFWFLPWDESGAPSEFSIGYMIVMALVGAFAVVAGVHAGMMYEPFAASDRTIPAVSIMSRNILHFTSGLPHGQFVWVGLILVLSWMHSVSRPGSLMKKIFGLWVPVTLGVVIAMLLLATVFPMLTMVSL